MPERMVELKNVSFAVGDLQILSDLNLQINEGEILILLGESGCGKTTTLKLINRLIEPTSGEVLVEGKATTDWDAIKLRRKIGYVLQEGGLFPHFTVQRNVALVPELENWENEKTRARVLELARTRRLKSAEIFRKISARTFRRSASARRCGACSGGKSRSAFTRRTVRRVGCNHADKSAKRICRTCSGIGKNRRFRHARSARSVYFGNANLSDGQRQNRARRNAGKFQKKRSAAGSRIFGNR